MAKVEEAIEVNVPVRTAYNQWTQFEEFPNFMSNVQEVQQVDDTHLRWRAKVAGQTQEWDAEITEQTPDQRVAWVNTTGPRNHGVVNFHYVDEDCTRVQVLMDVEPPAGVAGDTAEVPALPYHRAADLEPYLHVVLGNLHGNPPRYRPIGLDQSVYIPFIVVSNVKPA